MTLGFHLRILKDIPGGEEEAKMIVGTSAGLSFCLAGQEDRKMLEGSERLCEVSTGHVFWGLFPSFLVGI